MSCKTVWLYARCSDRKQAIKGDSVADQVQRGAKYIEAKQYERLGYRVVVLEDSGASAFSKPFFMREGGKQFRSKAQPGDILLIDKVDRLLRSIEDFADIFRWLEAFDCDLQIVDCFGAEMSLSSPMGKFMLTNLANFAELESALKSQRQVAACESRRSRNIAPNARPPVGCKTVKTSTERGSAYHWVYDWPMRRAMQLVVKFRHEDGLTWAQIRDLFDPSSNLPKFRTMYERELQYQEAERLSTPDNIIGPAEAVKLKVTESTYLHTWSSRRERRRRANAKRARKRWDDEE